MKKSIKKLLMFFILIISYIILNIICGNEAFAITQTTTTDINSIDSNQYPQIKEMLQSLKNAHPNWNFKILYTDIEWSDAIANEYVGHGASPRNLVPANNANYTGEWICPTCANTIYDSGNWNCASEAAIAYMIDARNSVNYSDIFQFMELTYSECNVDTIRTMVANTFLNNESYINAIIEGARTYNVNAYYIVARILQEQGTSGSTLSKGEGYNGQYVGVYNVFNIGASGNGKETVILNGLKKAQSKGWTTLESSIIGGTEIIAQSYIAKGQNTLYFQKFDVEYSDGNLYWHQYMQNILAAQKEGETLRKTFENMGSVDGGYTFIIPLFKNMPATAAPRPSTNGSATINTELVRVNVTNSLFLRSAPGRSSSSVASVYKDEIITRLEKSTTKVDGTYWDYVMKSDGTKGYAARETYESESTYKLYLVPINAIDTPAQQPEENLGTTTIKNDKVKIETETNEVTAVPGATGNDFANLLASEVVVKNANGELMAADAKLGTGCTINDTYTIVVLGDINGDGEVDARDSLRILKYSVGTYEIKDEFSISADLNKDGIIDARDSLRVLKYSVDTYKIEI